jgi:membrane protein implicated in regulation of membrane protease activity
VRTLDPLTAVVAIAIGVALIVLARWASRERGSPVDTWLALRVGDVLFTEMLGAFIVGFAIGDLFASDDEPGTPRRVGFGRFGGRFGGAGAALPLPFMLGLFAAAVAALVRIDWGGLFLRSRPAATESDYVGISARVIAHIPAGGVGEIAMPDARGNITSVVATADTDLTVGTPVRVTGIRGRHLVVGRSDGP